MASSSVTLKALGLNFSPNALELPPGSLIKADNVIIRRDDVIESRRGFKLFGEQIPDDELSKQIFIYRDRILRHYADRIAYQDGILNDGTAKFTQFGGNFSETKAGLRIKGLQEKNGNFYFTSIDGIKKISAADASQFTPADTLNPNVENYITNAGGVKALDLNATLLTTPGQSDGFLPENSSVAYKMVWGKVDANNVELLGTPSERVIVYNDSKNLMKIDFLRLLTALDNLTSPTTTLSLLNSSLGSISTTSGSSDISVTPAIREFKLNDIVIFGGTLPPELISGKNYYIVSGSALTVGTTSLIKVSNTLNGIPITCSTTTSAGTIQLVNNYYNTLKVDSDSTVSTLRDNVVQLATKLDTELVYAYGATAASDTPYAPLRIQQASCSSGQITITIKSPIATQSWTFGTGTQLGVTFPSTLTGGASSLKDGDIISKFDLIDVSPTSSVLLPSPLNSSSQYYVKNRTASKFELSESYNGTSIVFTGSPSGGTNDIIRALVNNALRYFSVGKKINLQNFKSNGVSIDALNSPQTVTAVELSSYTTSPLTTPNSLVKFTVSGYSLTNPNGISGIVESASATSITTTQPHGLKQGQIVVIGSTNYTVTNVTGDKTFTYTSGGGAPSSGSSWNIFIDTPTQSTVIESYTYRSIAVPDEIDDAIEPRGTAAQLESLRNYLTEIIDNLKSEPNDVIYSPLLKSVGISSFTSTISANVRLEFTVPYEINSSYFYRIYRTDIKTAQGVQVVEESIIPSTDYYFLSQITYNPTDKTSKNTIVYDDVDFFNVNLTDPETNALKLYTSGSFNGDQNPNDYVPFANDINSFNSYTFYASTKLKQLKGLNLLGITRLKDSLDLGITPKLLVADKTGNSQAVFKFVKGVPQVSTMTFTGAVPSLTTINFVSVSGDPILTSSAAHGFVLNDIVKTGATVPAGFLANTDYVVVEVVSLTQFKLAISSNNSAITPTSSGTFSGANALKTNRNYFDINSANNIFAYRFYYDLSGSDVAPQSAGKILNRIYLQTNSIPNITNQTSRSVNTIIDIFSATDANPSVVITYLEDGSASAITFTSEISSIASAIITTAGVGEDITTQQIALPSDDTIIPEAQLILTLKSLSRIINRNTASTSVNFDNYCYYDSVNKGNFTIEGSIFKDDPYYILTNTDYFGESFSPFINPISATGATVVSVTGGSEITFLTPHGFSNNDEIVIFDFDDSSNENSFGVFTVKFLTPTKIKVEGLTLTTYGVRSFKYINTKTASKSDNFKKKNRLYYSKFGIPEAVYTNPFVGYFIDIGSEEKEILRIFPLRESLFILKEDGLWRLSGQSAPFSVALFDSSCILIAPDSVAVSGNLIYCWTRQGITVVSESGSSIVSRPIDTEVLRLASSDFTYFKSVTFGVGYESDNSYIVWTVQNTTDEIATQAFRYSALTGTWTKYTKSNTCGLVNPSDDKLYLGAGDVSYLEQERKQFNRFDYADREYKKQIGVNSIQNNTIKFNSVSDISVGDSIVQEQYLTTSIYNSLLKKLDTDPDIGNNNYYSTLAISANANLRTAVINLATKLKADTGNDYLTLIADITNQTIVSISLETPLIIESPNHGLFTGRVINIFGSNSYTDPDLDGDYVVTKIDNNRFSIPVTLKSYSNPSSPNEPKWSTSSQNFYDIYSCYNNIISQLNSDLSIGFSNYQKIGAISYEEGTVLDVNKITKIVTLDNALPFVQGPVISYSSIPCNLIYSPITFGDPLMSKHIREATMMFANKAFTSASLSFSTDLLPAFIDVEFEGDGKGLFGYNNFGFNYFGGTSNSAPFRTYVPINCQRCRYLNIKFNHNNAREQYAIYGITLTGKMVSTRAYR